RGALEPFLDPGSGDDVIAIAEAESCLQRALLVPEVVEPVAQALELGGGAGVIAVGQKVPELRPALARQLDLVVDLSQGHVPGEAAGKPRSGPGGTRLARTARRGPDPPGSRLR